jgi:signal transduction histidine kinase
VRSADKLNVDNRDLRAYLASPRAPIELNEYRRTIRIARVGASLAVFASTLAGASLLDHPAIVIGAMSILCGVIIIHNLVRPDASLFEVLTHDAAMYLMMTVVIDSPELAVFDAMALSFMIYHFVPPRRALVAAGLFNIGGLAAAATSLFVDNQQRAPAETLLLLSIVIAITAVPALWLQMRAGAEIHFHRRKEEQLSLEKDELLADKDRFVASVSHEVRTPLTAVVGLAHALADPSYGLDGQERTELLATLVEQSEEVASIIDDLLTAARAGSGQLELVIGDVDLVAQAQAVAPEGTPIYTDFQATHLVRADPIRVRQILRNLLSNAKRYGGPNVRIGVRTEDSTTTVSVEDDGDAIPVDQIDEIFTPYGRAHDRPGLTDSVGLGLTVSRQLARMMGGDVDYAHADGWSTFRLSLPATVNQADNVGVDGPAAQRQ